MMSCLKFWRLLLLCALGFGVISNIPCDARSFPAFSDEKADVNGLWTPVVTLRDTTNMFPGDNRIARPKGGWWVSPIHANLLGSGKVLVTGWNRPEENVCKDHQGRLFGTSFLLDIRDLSVESPSTLNIQPLDEQPKKVGDVLYCSGHVPMADGRVLFTGGARYENLGDVEYPPPFKQKEYGLNYARIFDPKSSKFMRVEKINQAGPEEGELPIKGRDGFEKGSMWYPTNTRLPGGRVLVNGGLVRWIDAFDTQEKLNKWDFLNKSVIVFDPAKKDPWTALVRHANAPREVGIDVFDYPHVFLLPKPVMVEGLNRHIAIYGGLGWYPCDNIYKPGITLLSLDEEVPIESKRFVRRPNATRPQCGKSKGGMLNETTAAMTPDGKLVIMGGGDDGKGEGQRIDIYDPGTDTWCSKDTGITRHKASSTLLPDGSILFINGEEYYASAENVGDRTRPTLFDPRTKEITTLAPWTDDPTMRGYHAVSLLLKDGRVLIGGGRVYGGIREDKNASGREGAFRIGCERPELRIFSPPYLFKGTRPMIEPGTPVKIAAGGKPFTVKFNGPTPRLERGVVLMALGAFTHGFDQNQRAVPLTASLSSPGKLTVSPPRDTWEAPEGEYNLFLISEKGVPSVGVTVQIVKEGK